MSGNRTKFGLTPQRGRRTSPARNHIAATSPPTSPQRGRFYVNKHGVRVLDIPGKGPRALTPEPPRSSQGDSPPVSDVPSPRSPRSPVSPPSSSVSPGSISPVDPETSVYDATVPEITFEDILKLVRKLGIETTPTESVITGFNGLILGYAKLNGINGIGLYGELLEPRIPQYRAARTIIETLEKLTYQKLGDTKELSVKAEAVESRFSSEDDIPKG